MKRRELITLIGGAAAWPLAARAQQAGKVPRIGFLLFGSPEDTAYAQLIGAFRSGLRDLGYIEGNNIVIEYRYAGASQERLSDLAADLVRTQVDVIVANGTPGPLAAKRATVKIPIVMTSAGDPVGSGLVASLARPDGNVTGMSLMAPDLGGKRLELLKEALSRCSRVAVLWNSANPYPALVFKETQVAAEKLGIQVHSVEIQQPSDFADGFAVMRSVRPDAMIVVEDPLMVGHRSVIIDFAADHRLPALYGFKEFAVAGGLISYGAGVPDLYRRAASFVDKVLRGSKPADLPVQQPTKFELVINLKTAKALGLEIPPTVLARADEVIE